MSHELIFNDQRFASPEAQRDFYTRSAHLDPVYRDRLDRIMGSVSQFMPEFGKVLTFDNAVMHWEMWDEYMAGPHLEFLAERKAIADEQSQTKRRGRPKSLDPKIPKPPVDKPISRRPRGRPRTTPEPNVNIEKARQEWRTALKQAKEAEHSIDEWARQERARIIETASHSKKQWLTYVKNLKLVYEHEKSNNKL